MFSSFTLFLDLYLYSHVQHSDAGREDKLCGKMKRYKRKRVITKDMWAYEEETETMTTYVHSRENK